MAAVDSDGRTALLLAVHEGHVPAVEALLAPRQRLAAQRLGAAFAEAKRKRSFDLITALGRYAGDSESGVEGELSVVHGAES